ncbi:MAG TPA: hypothetical protein PK957_01495 [Candidatus Dojkabacteria bacterium]|nr:hypothetical protein [Candidatus Dojkabacteria bacterium]HQF36349.1 hypothetical protein [Candidatus Dojkabacteria bacterium]
MAKDANKSGVAKNDDVFEISLSEDSVKLLLPFAILIAGILICAAIIYSTAQLKDAWKQNNNNSNSSAEVTQETEQVKGATATQEEIPKSDKPTVQLFTMSYCPYGNIAEEFVQPVYEILGDKIAFEPRYIVSRDEILNLEEFVSTYGEEYRDQYSNYVTNVNSSCLNKDNSLICSKHGFQELNQDIREICVWKYQNDKFWDFVMTANTSCDYSNVDTCWEGVANSTGVNVDSVKDCYNKEFDQIVDDEIALMTKLSVTGSPTIYINGVLYNGDRSPEAFKNTLCSAFNEAPDACNTQLEDSASTATGGC